MAWPSNRGLVGSRLVCQLAWLVFAWTGLCWLPSLQLAHSLPVLGGDDAIYLYLASWLLMRMETLLSRGLFLLDLTLPSLRLCGMIPRAHLVFFYGFFLESLEKNLVLLFSTGLECYIVTYANLALLDKQIITLEANLKPEDKIINVIITWQLSMAQ